MSLRPIVLALFAMFAIAFVHAQEWRPLFTATSMDGWESTPAGRTVFKLEAGMLVSQPDAKGMLRYSREELGDVTLKLVYRISNKRGNGGVFVRIPRKDSTEGQAIHEGIEIQLDDMNDEWHATGVLYSMTKVKARPYREEGAWNTMEITLDGPRTVVVLNGTVVTDYDGVSDVPKQRMGYEPRRGPRPDKGYIGLQNHDDRAIISFREISVRPLR